MTQEEKFEEAKRLYETANADQRYVLESLFPELKEREDERIRKKLIDYFKENNAALAFEGISNESVITWIEKQKTSDEALQYLKENHSPSEVSDFQAAMNIAVAKAYDKGYNDGLKKQDEQKPTDKVKHKFKVGDEIKTVNEESLTITKIDDKGYWSEDLFICDFDEAVCWNLVEQNHAWSEEDATHYNRILKELNLQKEMPINVSVIEEVKSDIIWLKSIKDRVQPQLQWKPSDEQIKALETTIYTNMSRNDERYLVLSEFVEELKKLKG